ncbi:MAG TPA: serine hydrolase domain-containing protein, partial [Polyangiales bacterium]|nr:serine hydrolase domain-containing protein [Polyangiales bacterium]
MTEISGQCDPAFEAVRDAFRENFARELELGAAVAIQVGGRTRVSLWAGLASRAEQAPWREDTLVNVYSTTKGLAAMCIQHLVERGALELDATVARYWPEFAAAGKAAIRVRDLLGHRAGLCGVRERLPHDAIYDQATMARALAAAEPLWPPGTRHAYHAQTFGFLVAELVLRVTDSTLGRYLREHFAAPLAAEVYIGLPAEYDARVAKLVRPLGEAPPPGEMSIMQVLREEPDSLTALAFGNPASAPGAVNTRRWRGAEIPSSNGHASALGLAQLYGALAAGSGGLLSPAGLAR